MLEVTLYSRKDCHLCEAAQEELNRLQLLIPHHLSVVDVESDSQLLKEYGFEIPVIVAGPYTLRAPIDPKDLEVTLRAALTANGRLSKSIGILPMARQRLN